MFRCARDEFFIHHASVKFHSSKVTLPTDAKLILIASGSHQNFNPPGSEVEDAPEKIDC